MAEKTKKKQVAKKKATRKKATALPARKKSKVSRKKKASKTLNSVIPEIVDENSTEVAPPSENRALATADPVALYLSEIRRYPVLSREDEHKLAVRYYEEKDPEAAQALVKANLRFVVKVAAEYSKFGARMIDLIQEGNVGLMHAVREFNPYKGVRLITYAVWWIRGYIQEYMMRQYSMVRIGTTQNQRKLFYQLKKEKEALDAMGQEPTLALLSSRLGIPEDEISEMSKRMNHRDVSLDAKVDSESGTSWLEMQPEIDDQPIDEALALQEELLLLRERIEKLKGSLNERELAILEERILADTPVTLQEIGDRYGTTREAVRQMEVRVLKKIKDELPELAPKSDD